MLGVRVIPILLYRNGGLYKGRGFKDHRYVGDAMNAIRIYNAAEADELVLVDVGATPEGRCITQDLVQAMAMECYMPFAVGGGVTSVDQAGKLLQAGAEKITVGSAAHGRPELVGELAETFGSQSVVVSIDAGKKGGGYQVVTHCGKVPTGRDPVEVAREMERRGAGEILLTSLERDGTREGYDLTLIKSVSQVVNIPVIACGGAGKVDDFRLAVEQAGASAVAGGAIFVFHGRRQAVLISYPGADALSNILPR